MIIWIMGVFVFCSQSPFAINQSTFCKNSHSWDNTCFTFRSQHLTIELSSRKSFCLICGNNTKLLRVLKANDIRHRLEWFIRNTIYGCINLLLHPHVEINETHTRRLDHMDNWGTSCTLQWRHNGWDDAPNHRRLDYLFNRCSGADQRKHQSSASLIFS